MIVAPGPPGRRADGFTLVEAAIASLLLLLVLVVATDLLLESVRIAAASGRKARDPLPELATERLRRDLREARPPGFRPPLWAPLPLSLDRPRQGPVIWDLNGDRLVRTTMGPGGPVSRPLLDGVAVARWRAWPPGHYDVELFVVRESTSSVSAARGRSGRVDVEPVRILVGPRGEGDGW